MAKEYDGKINRNTKWGGDASTGFLPVKGSRVQEFIKDELNTKIGAVYKPEGENVVYYFANEDDKQAFIATEDMSYVLSSYETESKYEVTINQDGLVLSHSVIKGTTGNTIGFDFKIVDDNGMTADARARIELSFTGSGVSSKFTNEIPVVAGDWTHFSAIIDDNLRNGSNSIAVKIVGLSTKANTQFVMTYNIFDLSFDVNFEYNSVQTGNTILVPYIIECSDPKYLEFFIDGIPVRSYESMVISDIRMDSIATIDISNLTNGQHSLQVRAYVNASDGTRFYTPIHFYTFAKYGETTAFLMHRVSDDNTEIAESGENLKIHISQFEQIEFDWSIFDFLGRKLEVVFEYDGNVVSRSTIFQNGDIRTFSYRPMEDGYGKEIVVYALDENDERIFEYTIDVDVDETSSGIKETTKGLIMKFQSIGRRNTDGDKDFWEYNDPNGTYHAIFSGFTWNSQQGWDEETESLSISNGAVVHFDVQPMLNNWSRQGGAVEIDIETYDIEDEDAVICECKNNVGENEAFFRITATKAEFSTSEGTAINTRYKDNERLKIVFIGNKDGSHEDGNLIYIVVNGVLERAALYRSQINGSYDNIQSNAYLSIGDPTGKCKVRLRSIRVYNQAISVDEAFNNYVVDSDDVQGIYEKNNVLKAGSQTEIGFDEVANKIPVMIFTGDMNELVTEGQNSKKEGKWYNFDVEYINRQEPERNFVSFNCQMKLQGTSSLGYPRKNFKLKTKDKNFNADLYAASKFELDPNSVVGNLMLRNKETGLPIDFDDFKTNGTYRNTYCFTLDYKGEALKKGKYRFRKDAHKAQKWTLKADFMESSCSHNVGAGRSWNDIFENTELLNNGDAAYTNLTYKDSALVSGASREYIEYNGANIEGTPMHYKIPYNSQAIKDQKKYVCRTDEQKICIATGQDDVRTAVDGFPMVCFYRTSHAANDLVFIGQYNFINDKGSYEVFGFEDIEDPEDEETMIYDASKVEVWEGLKNTNPLALFKTIDGFYDKVDPSDPSSLFKWQETYEARYPDPEDYESNPESLFELSKWLVSTRHEDDTVYGGTIDVDSSFAERINTFQYGYTTDTADNYRYFNGTGLVDNAENRQKKFETEKWEHFDVWKLAGYYIYLRRYGAVDQFVKNTMLKTDGNGKYDPRTDKKYRKWYFINYDNDCLFGLRNNGQLAFHWDLDRQTIDSASDILIDDQADDEGTSVNAYAMMGHDSTLWNNLEADDEFMRMVRDLDYSMSKYKLNYANMVEEFDTKQTEQWCERIYNANERYKYIQAAKGIGDMEGRPVNNLWMLQGTRRSHRHWWIANHFNLLDAQWLSGDYKNTSVTIKTNCRAGTTIHARAGAKYYYAWGQDKKIYESNMQRNEGEVIDFTFATDQSQGDPVKIYSFNKMTEMDFSEIASLAYEGSFEFKLGNDLVQNTLKKLVIGNPNVRNTIPDMDKTTSTWINIPNLEYLDITNYEGMRNVPLNTFKNLHVFKAAGTKLGSFIPAEGASFELVELPPTVSSIALRDVSFKNNINEDLVYTPTTNLNSLTLSNNDGVGLDYYNKIVQPWLMAIEASVNATQLYQVKSLNISNIKWSFNNLNAVKLFKNFSKYGETFQMSGVIDLRNCGNLSMENIDEIKSIFGENCFNEKMSSLYIITPDSVFIKSEKTEMVAGQTNIFERVIYPDENAVIPRFTQTGVKFYIVEETTLKQEDAPTETIFSDPIGGKNYIVIKNHNAVRSGLSLENAVDSNGKQIGILRCDELVIGSDTTFKVLVFMDLTDSAYHKVSVMDFTVKDPTYVSTTTIDGPKSLYKNKEYTITLSTKTAYGETPIGSYNVLWTLTGEAVEPYIQSYGQDVNDKHKFIIRTNASEPDTEEISSMMRVEARVVNYDGTFVVNTFDMLVLNETVIMTIDSNPVVMGICHNAGWASKSNAMTKSEAEAVSDIGRAFSGITTPFSFLEFTYFTGVTALSESAFSESRISEIALPSSLTALAPYAFDKCTGLTNVYVAEDGDNGEQLYTNTLPNGIVTIPEGCFRQCNLSKMVLPDSVRGIENYAFGGNKFDRVLLHGSELVDGALILSNGFESVSDYAFEKERWTAEGSTNPLKIFEIPITMRVSSSGDEFLGQHFEKFVVEEGHPSYEVYNGALCDKSHGVIFRFPPQYRFEEGHVFETDPYYVNTQIVKDYAFYSCVALDSIEFGPQVAFLGEGACAYANVKTVDISQCQIVSYLQNATFKGCYRLEHVTLPTFGTLKRIGTKVFYNCPMLEEINIPNGVEKFDVDTTGTSNAIYGCGALKEVVFPDSVKKLGFKTISNCAALEKVVFPSYYEYSSILGSNGTLVLSTLAREYDNVPVLIVSNCQSLSSVTLPAFTIYDENEENVVLNTYVLNATGKWYKFDDGSNAIDFKNGMLLIDNNRNIAEINIAGVDNGNAYVSVNGAIYTADKKTLLRYPWNKSDFVIPEEVENIGSLSCNDSKITGVTFASNVKNIGEGAFNNCSLLAYANLETIATLGEESFRGVNIEEVVIGSGLEVIPQHCFDGCGNLRRVLFKGFNGEIDRFAFAYTPKVSEIIVSAPTAPKLRHILYNDDENGGWYQFNGCGTQVSNKKLLVSVGASESYMRRPWLIGSADESDLNSWMNAHGGRIQPTESEKDEWGTLYKDKYYLITEETTWRYLVDNYGFEIREEIPLSGVCNVTIYNEGVLSTGIVYAESTHLPNGYSVAPVDGEYLFELDGLYDGEEIRIYSDSEKTNEIGSFKPTFYEREYVVGSPLMSMAPKKTRLFSSGVYSAPVVEQETDEMAEITKSEYEELMTKVNQMSRIIKNLVK